MKKHILIKILSLLLVVFILSGCAEKKKLDTPVLTLNQDGSISVSEVENASGYLFFESDMEYSLDTVEGKELDLKEYKLGVSKFLRCIAIDSSDKYLNSDYSNIIFNEYTNSVLNTILLNPKIIDENTIEYSTNFNSNNLLLSFDYDNNYNASSFKIKINDKEIEELTNPTYYDKLVSSDTNLSKIRIESSNPSLIKIKVNIIEFNEVTSFNKDTYTINYELTCSDSDYFSKVNKELSAKVDSIDNILEDTTNYFFKTSGNVVLRKNDSSLSCILYDIDTMSYIKIESFSLFNTGFSYGYSNNKFSIKYTEAFNLINNNEYYFSDGDYINILLYKDTINNKYYAEVINKDDTKSFGSLNTEFSLGVIESSTSYSYNQDTYKLGDTVEFIIDTSFSAPIKNIKVKRIDGSSIELDNPTINGDEYSYSFNYQVGDTVVVNSYINNYKILENIDDNNNLYYSKETKDTETNKTTTTYLYKINSSTINNISLSRVIVKVDGYIYSIDDINESITFIELTNTGYNLIEVRKLSEYNTAFSALEPMSDDAYTMYQDSNTFSNLELIRYAKATLLLVKDEEYNYAYGELYSVDESDSLTSTITNISLNKSNNDILSSLSINNHKNIYHIGDIVEISVNVDDNETFVSLTLNGNEITPLNNKATITLGFENELVLTTTPKVNTTTYTIVGDNSDEIDCIFTYTDTTKNNIVLDDTYSIYSTESKGTIKSIKVTLNSDLAEGSIYLYHNTSIITDISSLTPITSTITDTTILTYTFDLSLYTSSYFYICSDSLTLSINKIEVTVES